MTATLKPALPAAEPRKGHTVTVSIQAGPERREVVAHYAAADAIVNGHASGDLRASIARLAAARMGAEPERVSVSALPYAGDPQGGPYSLPRHYEARSSADGRRLVFYAERTAK